MLSRLLSEPRCGAVLALCCALALALATARARAQGSTADPAAAPASTVAQIPPTATPTAPVAAQPATAATAERDALLSGRELDLTALLREGGESLTAERAAELAVESSPSLDRVRALRARAAHAADEVKLAVYPRLELEASYTRLSEHDPARIARAMGTFGGQAASFDIETVQSIPNVYALEARLSYPVSDLFLKILPRHAAATELEQVEALRGKALEQSVALEARLAFYDYARARAGLLVARAALEQTQAQRADVAALVSAGVLARVEAMRADAQVAATEVAVARSVGSVAVAEAALRALLHTEGESGLAVAEDLTLELPALTETRAELVEQARQNRPELQTLRTLLSAQAKNRDADAAGKWPQLLVSGSYLFANPNQRAAPYEEELVGSWALMGLLRWSPNDFAASDARVSQTEADRALTEADLRAIEDALRTEVAQAFEAYGAAQAAFTAARTGIAAAEESYRVRREQLRAGATVATDVIDAETDLRRARLELIGAAIDARVARARLERAVARNR